MNKRTQEEEERLEKEIENLSPMAKALLYVLVELQKALPYGYVALLSGKMGSGEMKSRENLFKAKNESGNPEDATQADAQALSFSNQVFDLLNVQGITDKEISEMLYGVDRS